jgi:hypothetical protein
MVVVEAKVLALLVLGEGFYFLQDGNIDLARRGS